jgi:hypothetical protein
MGYSVEQPPQGYLCQEVPQIVSPADYWLFIFLFKAAWKANGFFELDDPGMW